MKKTKYKEGVVTDSVGEKFIGKIYNGTYYTWDKNGDYHSVDGNPGYHSILPSNKIPDFIEKIYYNRGHWHREGAPAFYRVEGITEWWVNDELHREDGPAIVYPPDRLGAYDLYFLHGERVDKERIDTLILQKRLSKLKEL